MKTTKRNNTAEMGRMIQTLSMLSLGIVLTNYTTGDFSWQSTIAMIVVIVGVLAGNAFVNATTKSSTE